MTGVLPKALQDIEVSELPVWFGRGPSATTPTTDAPVDVDDRGNTDDDFHGCDDCNEIDDDDFVETIEDAAEDIAEILGDTEKLTDTDADADSLRSEALTGRLRPTAADLMYRRRKAISKR